MDYLTSAFEQLTMGIPSLIVAVLLLILAFIVANIAKNLTVKVLKKLGVEEKLAKSGFKDEQTGSSTTLIGKLVFLIVFLLFLPSVLDRLGMQSVAQPITNAVNSVINFLPNLLAAGIILFIGFFVAKLVRNLAKGILNGVGLNKLQEKIGVQAIENQNTFSDVISGVLYALILIPVIIAALQVLGLNSIAIPLQQILDQIFGYIPRIFVSIVLLVIGFFLAKLISPLIENILTSVGVDRVMQGYLPESKNGISISKIISEIVRWIILVVFFVESMSVLNLDILTTIGAAIIAYLPMLISSLIIIVGGYILASWIESLVLKNSPKNKSLALGLKVLILIVVGFMTVSQLGLAKELVNMAFIIILSAIAIAFAIAFGIGGRDFAKKRLDELDIKIKKEENK